MRIRGEELEIASVNRFPPSLLFSEKISQNFEFLFYSGPFTRSLTQLAHHKFTRAQDFPAHPS